MIVNCPKCDERVMIPSGASRQARVQCPLCVEPFTLSEVLDRLPPTLLVLDDDSDGNQARGVDEGPATFVGITAAEPVGDGQAAAGQTEDSERPAAADVSPAEAAPAPSFDFEAGTASAAAAPAATSVAARRTARPQRREKNPLREITKVVGGGVIGLTIGTLILWWLPGSWKRDPFKLGPVVSRYLPFIGPAIVPAKFHDKSLAEEPSADAPVAAAGQGFNATAQDSTLPTFEFSERALPGGSSSSRNKQRPQDRSLATGFSGDAADTADGSGDPAPGTDDVADVGEPPAADPLQALPLEADTLNTAPKLEVPMINLESFPSAEPAAKQKQDETAKKAASPPAATGGEAPPDDAPPTPPETAPQPTLPPLENDFDGVRNAPQISVTQLSERFSGAVNTSSALDDAAGAPVDERRELIRAFYTSFAELGEAVTFVDQNDQQATEQINAVVEVLREMAGQPDKLSLIGKVAPSWIANPRPNNGVLLYGTVESITPLEPYYVTRLVLPNQQAVHVLSKHDPVEHLAPQVRVLLLGTILEEPRKNLGRYTGAEPRVVLDGFHVALPAE